jgi:hypothetical protein
MVEGLSEVCALVSLSLLVIAARTEMLPAAYEPSSTSERVGAGCFLLSAYIAEAVHCRFDCRFVSHFLSLRNLDLIDLINLY